jgi:hypothetical protein
MMAVLKDPRFYGALAKEAILVAKEIGVPIAVELLRSVRQQADPKEFAQRVIKLAAIQRSYLP